MFVQHVKREAANEMRARNHAFIAGLWANTNLDADDADRIGVLERADELTEIAIEALYASKEAKIEADIPWEDPLFAPMRETVYSEEFDAAVREAAGRIEGGNLKVTVIEEQS